MRAIYRYDGTIKQCGDYPEDITAEITANQAANRPLYRVNPNTKEVYLAPTCDPRFINIIDGVLIGLPIEEQNAILAKEQQAALTQQVFDGDQVELNKRNTILQAEEDRVSSLKETLDGIDIKSIRAIREYIIARGDAPKDLLNYELEAVSKRGEL